MNETYEELYEKVSNEYKWKKDVINGSLVFWIPWEQTGAFNSIEDAKNNSLRMNENNEVIWAYSYNDLKQLLNI